MTARERAQPAERIEPYAAPAPPRPVPTRALTPATVLALQSTAGNAAVSKLMRNHAAKPAAAKPPAAQPAAAEEEVRVVEFMPTLPEPGVKYVIGTPDRRYAFDVMLEGGWMHFQNLTSEQAVAKLRMFWKTLHNDLDNGREANLKEQAWREEHTTVGFWSDVRGRTYLPEPAMWDRIGRGTLYEALKALDTADAVLKEQWDRDQAWYAEQGPPELRGNRFARFDATEERIKHAAALLEKAGRELAECQRRLYAYRNDTGAGAGLMLRDVKISIFVLSAAAGGAGAGFAGEGAGILSQAAYGAGTMAFIGAVDETAGQAGEIYYGLRDHFDVAKLTKRVARDVVLGFVGGVVGGKFSQVLKNRLGPWAASLTEAEIAASGLTREELLTNFERLFLEWVGGSMLSSPFTTVAGHLYDGAINGKFPLNTWGEFADSVFHDLVASTAMGGFLTYAGHMLGGGPGTGAKAGRVKPAATAEPHRASTGHPKPPKRSNPEYVKQPGRRSTGHPKPPKPPVIEESPPGGFEPMTKEPAHDDYGLAPHQEEIVLPGDTPKRETRTNNDHELTRRHYKNAAELRKGIRKALRELRKKAAAREKGEAREIDVLIERIKKRNPALAEQVRRYYAALENPRWVEEQMVRLWEKARDHGRTPADELEHIIGDGKGPNEFRNDFSNPDPAAQAEDFRKRVVLDPRVFVDMNAAGDAHGAYTHAFQQYLGDRLFGPGEGLKFRLELAKIEGRGTTVHPGQEDAYDEELWASTWDEMFDADGDGNMHSPEAFGPLLQEQLDFPRWNPGGGR